MIFIDYWLLTFDFYVSLSIAQIPVLSSSSCTSISYAEVLVGNTKGSAQI